MKRMKNSFTKSPTIKNINKFINKNNEEFDQDKTKFKRKHNQMKIKIKLHNNCERGVCL